MKIVLLTGTSPGGGSEHRFVAHRLAAEFGAQLGAVIAARNVSVTLAEKVKRAAQKRRLLRLCFSKIFELISGCEKRRTAKIEKLFGRPASLDCLPQYHLVDSHNGVKCQELLEKIKPDLILVYGTRIIKNSVIQKAGKIALNMHTGLSPDYRGHSCTFWPLYEGEADKVGVTIHELTEKVDGGRIFRTSKPRLHQDDDEASLFVKSVRVGLNDYIQTIKDLENGVPYSFTQDLSRGREYYGKDRTVWAELKVLYSLKRGLLRGQL